MSKLSEISNRFTCVIIDDDPFIQELLKDKLNLYFPEISIAGVGNNGETGIKQIQRVKPDLVFLDVEMNDMTGFEMLSKLESIKFQTIFITSYKHYAIKAIRFNALDYLLKPFDLEELKTAIKRFKNNFDSSSCGSGIDIALNNLKTKDTSDQTLVLKTQQGVLHLHLKNIIHIDGDRNYSFIYLTNNKKELISKTLNCLEELLEDKGFFRCHKSHIVNKTHVLSTPKSFEVELSNGIKIPISRRKKSIFMHWFDT